MKKIKYAPLAALFILPCFVSPVLAEKTVAGVIHFYGRVVEAPCQLSTINNQIIMDCPNSLRKGIYTTKISVLRN